MTTLRREIITVVLDEIRSEATDIHLHDGQVELSERIADKILSLRAFKATDEKKPEYKVGRDGWKKAKRAELEAKNPELALYSGEPISQETIDAITQRKEALDAFERDMKFNPLPWYTDRAWEKFGDFVVREYQKDTLIFAKYKTWQQNEGKFHALSNRKIRQSPQILVDCFPDFLAHSAMYGKTQTKPSESKALQFDESGRLISY